MTVSMSFSSTISPAIASETLITVARSRCSTGVWIVAVASDGCLFGSDLRVELHELSNLRVGSPAAIARSGIPQVSGRNRLEAARRIKASGPLVGDRLDVDKAVGVRRTHGFLIEVLSVEHTALNPGDLGTHERLTALEGDGVVLGPRLELLVVTDQRVEVLLPRVARGRLMGTSTRQRAVKLEVRRFRSLPPRPR